MFVKVVKIQERLVGNEKFHYLVEITLNTNHITFLSENYEMKQMLSEGKIDLDLHNATSFTDIKLSTGKNITVVGNTRTIETKISKTTKKILRG